MDMIVKMAKKMNKTDIRNLYVFTDDEPWLEAEKKLVKVTHPEWNIFNLEAPKPDATTKPMINDGAVRYAEERIYKGMCCVFICVKLLCCFVFCSTFSIL